MGKASFVCGVACGIGVVLAWGYLSALPQAASKLPPDESVPTQPWYALPEVQIDYDKFEDRTTARLSGLSIDGEPHETASVSMDLRRDVTGNQHTVPQGSAVVTLRVHGTTASDDIVFSLVDGVRKESQWLLQRLSDREFWLSSTVSDETLNRWATADTVLLKIAFREWSMPSETRNGIWHFIQETTPAELVGPSPPRPRRR